MIRLCVPGTLKYRDLAVRVVAAACKLAAEMVRDREIPSSASSPGNDFDDAVISAFGEAFNNCAIHSYRGRPIGNVEVEIELGVEQMTIRIIDYGSSFDITRVPDPDLDSLPEHGLGIFIIKSFMNDVTYRSGSPNVLSLTKDYTSLRGRPATTQDHQSESPPGRSPQ